MGCGGGAVTVEYVAVAEADTVSVATCFVPCVCMVCSCVTGATVPVFPPPSQCVPAWCLQCECCDDLSAVPCVTLFADLRQAVFCQGGGKVQREYQQKIFTKEV